MNCKDSRALGIFKKRAIEAIKALVACIPSAAGITTLTTTLNSCTSLEEAQSVFNLAVQETLCWLSAGGASAGNCIRPWPCDTLTIDTRNPLDPTGANYGQLNIWDPWAKGFLFPYLVHAFGDLKVTPNNSDDPFNMPFLTSISAPVLEVCDGSIFTSFQNNLLSVSFPSLTTVGVDCIVGSSVNQRTTDIHNLRTVGQDLSVGGVLNTELDMTALETVGRDALLGATPIISVPNLGSVGRDIHLGLNGPTHTVDMTGLTGLGGNFQGSGAALTQATVDSLLQIFAAISPALTGRTFLLDGGTNSPPGPAGIAAAAILTGNGNSVITN